MTTSANCLDRFGLPKKSYVSAAQAHRELAHSFKWRRRASWPVAFKCECGHYHLTKGGES
jgi:hypothetical protein